MTKQEILSYADHTVIKNDASWNDIKTACDDASSFKTATVCIPNCYVRRAAFYIADSLASSVKIDTLAGFPYGYNTTESKLYEAGDAIKNGADEIDAVANICQIKNGRFDYVLDELKALREVCRDKILKVIIETCLLTDDEKIRMCELTSEAGCDFVKTSTGFVGQGATFGDVKLMCANVHGITKVKAAGGIKTFEDAEKFIELGAKRLGTSSLVKIMKKEEAGNY